MVWQRIAAKRQLELTLVIGGTVGDFQASLDQRGIFIANVHRVLLRSCSLHSLLWYRS